MLLVASLPIFLHPIIAFGLLAGRHHHPAPSGITAPLALALGYASTLAHRGVCAQA